MWLPAVCKVYAYDLPGLHDGAACILVYPSLYASGCTEKCVHMFDRLLCCALVCTVCLAASVHTQSCAAHVWLCHHDILPTSCMLTRYVRRRVKSSCRVQNVISIWRISWVPCCHACKYDAGLGRRPVTKWQFVMLCMPMSDMKIIHGSVI